MLGGGERGKTVGRTDWHIVTSVTWSVAPLHAAPTPDVLLLGVVGLAALGSAVLLGLGLAVLARRRSQPYLLVVLALAALLARSVVAALGVVEVVPTTDHHVAEHSLDVAMAALVIGAVYYARGVEERARRRLGGQTDGGGRTDGGVRREDDDDGGVPRERVEDGARPEPGADSGPPERDGDVARHERDGDVTATEETSGSEQRGGHR